ncbi:MAG: hypothetical protein ACI8S6_004576 [Myxococcota bacterium]|jgi:hypothetical protein
MTMTMTTMESSVLSLPREQWADHPRYPDQVLLLGSHRNFRHISRVLARRARDGGDVAGIGWTFSAWKGAMGGHEHYEESKLYPYLEARWGLSCEPLREGHHHLTEHEAAVRAALRASDGAALADALAAHDETLNEHLDLEESIVIPALLALTPDEFEAYYHSSIHTLLRQLRADR